jgi:S-adenosylmethionine-dependent methyltransferase
MTDSEIFNQNIDLWQQEQQEPWMALRYRLELGNILGYAGEGKLEILDAGGGNGVLALALVQAGHRVTIVDYSAEMLGAARVKIGAVGLQDEINLHQADLHEIPTLFLDKAFDLVLCHNVIQYVSDPMAALSAVQAPLRDTGILSIVTVNKYAEVYKAAFREKDLLRAKEQLTADNTVATLFDHSIQYFTPEDLHTMMLALGYRNIAFFGVRCINDWLPNAPKYNPEYMASLEALEIDLSQKFPYYLLARFFQLIGRKHRSAG